ncbi:DUF881 domain-containing protein [Ornithinimicrobium sp. LYQ121]|uniref:DUF881 domain-containing protein n=1 Tax=Ornithinimicrobium sp. LYQ121 TaxID=3378801 RepID=UPI003851E3F4
MTTTPEDPAVAQPTAAPRPTHRRARTAGVTVICLLAGVLFGTSASLARERTPASGASDLVTLITTRDQQVRQLSEDAEELQAEVEELQQGVETQQRRALSSSADALAPAVGLAAVSGPAVSVTLDDAGYTLDTLPDGYSVDDVVVHQQDLQGVINALWAGGAEAITVMDQRLVSTSSVQCVGNTLYLQGRVYSPPFTVTAIGDRDALHAALERDPVVTTYRQWADAIGLGYVVQDLDEVDMPAYAGSIRPQAARVVEPSTPQEEPSVGD